MGLLGKPLGIFSLDESDRYIGSFISITYGGNPFEGY